MAENSPINIIPAQAGAGLNLSAALSGLKPGQLSFSINAVTSSSDGDSIKYQNEPGNVLYSTFPAGYRPNGRYNITEANLIVFWLVNDNGDSEIGTVTDGVYSTYINADCIGLDENYPIHKAFHQITPKGIEVYWTDALNERRYINLSNKPLLEIPNADGCGFTTDGTIDCNKLAVQPDFDIPQITPVEIGIGGSITAGTYEFAAQYASADAEPYTSFYSISNPLPIGNTSLITPEFNYAVGKSIKIDISNIDTSGVYKFLNIAVIKTINLITSVELVGTYLIEKDTLSFIYNGQKNDNIRLTIDDIFQKYPIYEKADDIFKIDDILGWSGVTTNERINYQEIWSKIHLQWQTARIPNSEGYNKELTSVTKKGYFRDEIYALEGCFLLRNGHQTDKCHIPGRIAAPFDVELIENEDSSNKTSTCDVPDTDKIARWKIYNTASVTGYEEQWLEGEQDNCYNGNYQYGEFAYTESSETYPCDVSLWRELAGKPIRHHKFPDSLISHIHDNSGNIYPIGIKIDVQQLVTLINGSSLSDSQKNDIVGFKILRADRIDNKSIIARGLIHNVLKYSTTGQFTEGIAGTIQTQVGSLFTTLLDIISKTDPVLGPLAGNSIYQRMQDVKSEIHLASLAIVGSEEYKLHLSQANNLLTEVLSLNINDVMKSYLEGAQSILENLLNIEPLDEIEAIDTSIGSTNELYFPNYLYNDVTGTDPFLNNTLIDDSAKSRYVFHSPDTHFYQPYLGNVLKLETIETGNSNGHITEVKKHSKYQFLSTTAYITAALSGLAVGFASGQYGVSTQPFDGTAAFTAYKTILDILYRVSPRRNFCYQYNSIGHYNKYVPVLNNGNKQRNLDIATYLIPGIQSVSDDLSVNNFDRESAIYLKTNSILPFTHEQNPLTQEDSSKLLVPSLLNIPANISSYYATIKNITSNQYEQIYSYTTIDTGFQRLINLQSTTNSPGYVFGGDCFINRFAYKSKIPFFIDNRVGFPDEADVFYDELENVGKPKYWFSTDVSRHNTIFGSIFGIKPHKFFWQRNSTFTDFGNIFLFAYGIPYFYCESEVNVDFRQAFNDKEGDFYPRVSSGIPDDWLQEINTSIKQDNTYFYNKTFSKQNKENFFSSIPADFTDADKRQYLSHSAVYSDPQKEIVNYKHNNWLLYKPTSRFDFPKSYGSLISVDGVWDKQVFVRYENAAQLYNAFTTINTSSPKAAYLGNDSLFKSSPPIDFAVTETGYGGGWNKLMVATEVGMFMYDTKRGTFLILERGRQTALRNISGDLSIFLAREMRFYIKDQFPSFPVDNHFKDVGLTGVFDNDHYRIVITKRDYKCIDPSITYTNNKFFKGTTEVFLTDKTYFTNKSFTLSFGLDINNFVSFHTYIPNYYVAHLLGFYSGTKTKGLWKHHQDETLFNNFYGDIHPYILEFPYSYKFQDEILQNVKDYTRVFKYDENGFPVMIDDIFFNEAILYNEQQCSGVLKLEPKPKNNLNGYMKYPKYHTDSKTIMYTKSDSFYNYNTFWSLIKDKELPIFSASKDPSMFKELNNTNMNYSKMSYGKAPLRSKNLRVRHSLTNTSRYKLISEFTLTSSQISYK